MEVVENNKIDNKTVEIVYDDGSKKIHKVIKCASRKVAIGIAERKTKEALLLPGAYDRIGDFENDFSRHRNYEIEWYLDNITGAYYRIDELCPFNNFKWFD